MEKRKIIIVLIGMLLLVSFSALSSSNPSSYILSAKGGVRGPPNKPTPPEEEGTTDIMYELFIEIDYMQGFEPTATVLTYIHDYFYNNGIEINFYVDLYDADGNLVNDNPYSEVVSIDASVSSVDFWMLETEYNDVIVYDDQANDSFDSDGDGYDGEHLLKEKWVLLGTTVENQGSVMGYTSVIISSINPKKADVIGGNYIYLACEGIDDWAKAINIDTYGAEAVVLMHEIGHSIGLGVIEWNVFYGWVEIYDRDSYSVMSYLNIDNAGYYGQWYYSDKYWNTRNMEYYNY